MTAYKVINLDNPIESDYWVDIPVRDPATNVITDNTTVDLSLANLIFLSVIVKRIPSTYLI